jgi:alpha-beta hydrolase superfamily lysophospholipase
MSQSPAASALVASGSDHADGFINSKDHLRLYWQSYSPRQPRATVAVLHGYGDHGGRYQPLVEKLVEGGFATSLLDFRGHGQSDGRRGHIDAFQEYLDDLDAFVAKLRADAPDRKLFVVCHSHGALIATRWALERPRAVDGFVMSAPYFRLAFRPSPLKIVSAKMLGKVVPWLPVPTGIAIADLSRDEELQRRTEADPLYNRSATPRWFDEALRTQIEVLRRASEFAAPVLVVSPGADRVADSRAARQFFEAAASKDKEFKTYDGYRHEPFNEVGGERPIGDAVAWILARA